MTREQYVIKRKLNILDLSDQLKNISGDCRTPGIYRRHFYDIKKAIEEDDLPPKDTSEINRDNK